LAEVRPHVPWSHRLKNGAPAGNPTLAPRCGARTRAGTACRQPAMRNGRCRLHGGNSTGPRTEGGVARLRAARTKHGHWGQESRAFRRYFAELLATGRMWLLVAKLARARRGRLASLESRLEKAVAAAVALEDGGTPTHHARASVGRTSHPPPASNTACRQRTLRLPCSSAMDEAAGWNPVKPSSEKPYATDEQHDGR
jgi:hypothetical protein